MHAPTICPLPRFSDDTIGRNALRYERLTTAARVSALGARQPVSARAPNRRARRSQCARTRVSLVGPRSGAPPQPTVAQTESVSALVRPAQPDRAVMSPGGFVKIASTTAFGPPTDISTGSDGTVWAIDASGAPHLLDLLNDRWQPFGEGVDATAASGGSTFYFRGVEVLEIQSSGSVLPPVPIKTRFPGLPDSFNYGLSGAVSPGGVLYLIRAGWYVPADGSRGKARLTDLKNWPKSDKRFADGLIDAAWDDGTAAFLARDGQFIKVDFGRGEVSGAPASLSQYAPWSGKLPDGWAAGGIDAALWQVSATRWMVFNGPAVAAFDNQKAAPAYLGASVPGWPMAWNPRLSQAPSGRLGALISILADNSQSVLFYDGKAWSQNGAAKSACRGADGSAFATSTQLFYWKDGGWLPMQDQPPQPFVQVAAGDGSMIWGCDSSGTVYRHDSSGKFLATKLGPATAIAAGSDGTLWSCRNNDPQAYLSFFEPEAATTAVPVAGAGGTVLHVATCGLSQAYALARHQDGSIGVYRYDLPYVFRSRAPWPRYLQDMVQGGGRIYRLDSMNLAGKNYSLWRVAAVDAHTGAETTSVDLPEGPTYGKLAYDPVRDLVYVGAAPVDPNDNTSSGELFALALDGGKLGIRWTYTGSKGIDTAPAVSGGAVYFGDRSGTLTKIDGGKGSQPEWTWPIWGPEPFNHRVTTPQVVDDTLYGAAWRITTGGVWFTSAITCRIDGTERFASKDHGFWINSGLLGPLPAQLLGPPILGSLSDGGNTVPVLYLNGGTTIVAYKVGSSGLQQPATFDLPSGARISTELTYDDGTRAGRGLSGKSLDSNIRIWFGDDHGSLWGLDRQLNPIKDMPKTVVANSVIYTTPQLYKDPHGGVTVLFGLNSSNPGSGFGGGPYLYGYNPDTGDVSTIRTGNWYMSVLCRGISNGVAYCGARFGALSPILAMRVDTIVQGLRYFLVDSQMMQDPDEHAANYTRTDSPIPPSRARYQTHLTVIDDQKLPLVHEPLKVWADAPTTIRVDGKPYSIGPGNQDYAVLQTGSDGTVVVTSGYSLADGSDKPDIYVPALRVWAGFMDPFERIVVNPDHLFHLRIATAHADSGDDDPDKVNLMTAQSYACAKPNAKPADLFTTDDKTNKQPENCAKAIGQMRSGVGFGGSSENAPGMLFDRLMLHAGGERQARRAIRAGRTADAGGSPARYIAAEKPPEAGYFPADIAARRAVTLNKSTGMLLSKPKGIHPSKTTYREVDHATAQDEFDNLPANSWQPSSASLGGHRVGNIFTDFWHWLTHLADEVVVEITHIVVAIADDVMVGIRMLVNGVEQVFKAIVTVIDDIASAIGSFFHMLAKIIEDVIAALSVFFHFGHVLAVQSFLNGQIRNGLDKVAAAALQNIKPMADGLFKAGEAAIKKAFDGVIAKVEPNKPLNQLPGAGATQRSVFLAKRGAAGPGSDGASHAAHCAWGVQKMKSGLPAAKSKDAGMLASDTPLEQFWTCFDGKLASDPALQNALSGVKTQFDSLFHASSGGDFFRSLLAALLSVLELLAETALVIAQAFLDCLFDILEALMSTIKGWLDYPIDIPVLTWLFGWLTGGEPLTLLNLITLIVAIPVTMLYRVVEGEWPTFSQTAGDIDPRRITRILALSAAAVLNFCIGIVSGCLDFGGREELLELDRKYFVALLACRIAMVEPQIFKQPPSPLDWSLWGARICAALVPTLGLSDKARNAKNKKLLPVFAFAVNLFAFAMVIAIFFLEHKFDPNTDVGFAAGIAVSLPGMFQLGKLCGGGAGEYIAIGDVAMGLTVCALDVYLSVEVR